jgi:hypothetical protein
MAHTRSVPDLRVPVVCPAGGQARHLRRETVEKALARPAGRFKNAREHLATSMKVLGKPNPDYRNSMKQAISAVESAVRGMPGIKETNTRRRPAPSRA